MKVIFHINEAERWPRVIMNTVNFLRDVEGEAVVEVLANGAGVLAYSQGDRDLLSQMEELSGQGVYFAACRNALKLHGIFSENLPPFVKVVSAGITELARKQAQGFAYIKP
ncbi:MAG: DsrE family protein [Bacillota bacterium]|jgi:intracellular sulfur oxidation DsrE/DsrF family protein